MPELLAAFERGGQHFATVGVTVAGDTRDVVFGVPLEEYRVLRRILQTRPFDPLCTLRYRYIIAATAFAEDDRAGEVHVRIEQGSDGRQFRFPAPVPLLRNLLWFIQLRDFADASHVHVTPVAPEQG